MMRTNLKNKCSKNILTEDLFNKPVNEIIFNIKSIKDIDKISDLVDEEGSTEVRINIRDENNDICFNLKISVLLIGKPSISSEIMIFRLLFIKKRLVCFVNNL